MYRKATFCLYIITLLLAIWGIIILFSASANFAYEKLGDSFYFVKRQTLWLFFGLIAQVFVIKAGYHKIAKHSNLLFISGIILLILVLIPIFSAEIGGARRWLRLGPLGLQPSEFMKLIIIIFISKFLADKSNVLPLSMKTFAFICVISVIVIALILAEKDLGTTIILGIIISSLLFISGISKRFLSCLFLISIPFIYLAILLQPFRFKRITAFLDPWGDPQGSSYQIIQSLVAISSGGWFGKGLGKGIQKYYYLPEAHTDFIFSIHAEETGFLGSSILICLFIILLIISMKITARAVDRLGYLLGMGLTLLIGVQFVINLGVVSSILPTKGTPLPFISFGGSSLVVNMIAVGMLISIEKYSRLRASLHENFC